MLTIFLAIGLVAQASEPEVPPDLVVRNLGRPYLGMPELTPDGRWLMVRDETRNQIRLVSTVDAAKQVALSVANVSQVSPDGRWLCGSVGNRYYLFDLANSPEPRQAMVFPESNSGSPRFTDDSRYMMLTYPTSPESTWLLDSESPFAQTQALPRFYFVGEKWRVETAGETELRFTRRQGSPAVRSMQISRDSAILVPETTATSPVPYSGPLQSGDFTQREWLVLVESDSISAIDLRSDDPSANVHKVTCRLPGIHFARVAPDGSWLAIPDLECVHFVDTRLGSVRELDTAGRVEPKSRFSWVNIDQTSFVRSGDGRWLYYAGYLSTTNGMVGGERFEVRLWDLESAPGLPLMKIGGANIIGRPAVRWQLAFSPDSHWLLGVPSLGDARLWDLHKPIPFESISSMAAARQQIPVPAAISDDGMVLASTDPNADGLRAWRVDQANVQPFPRTLGPPDVHVGRLAFIPGTHVLVALAAEALMTWDLDVADPQPIVVDSRVVADGYSMALPRRYGDIAVLWHSSFMWWWNFRARNPEVMVVPSGRQDARFVVAQQNGELCLWDLQRPHTRRVLQRAEVEWFEFRGRGAWLAAGTKDNDLLMWNLQKLATDKPAK